MTLSARQQAWLDAQVASGEFASAEEAIAHLIDERIADEEDNDMLWAKPFIDEALAEAERGEFITLEDHRERMKTRLAALRTGE